MIGDAYLVGYVEHVEIDELDPGVPRDPSAPGTGQGSLDREVWTVVSPNTLVRNDSPKDGESRLSIKGQAGRKSLRGLPDDARVFRIWRPHEEWPDMADSLVRGVLLECEELYALGRSIKAVSALETVRSDPGNRERVFDRLRHTDTRRLRESGRRSGHRGVPRAHDHAG